MNFQEFKTYRDQVAAQQSVLRLDCMNPFIAMNFLKAESSSLKQRSNHDTLDMWAETMGVERYRDMALASCGVRESLKGLFNVFAAEGRELWLPEDVYPFYWDAANNSELVPRSFPTLPAPDFTGLGQAASDGVAVITNPISPLGRVLSDEETSEIKAWLADSRDRQIILDTVYSYTRDFDNNTIELFETGQCYVAHSLSKAWLERGVFGALLTPEKYFGICKAAISRPSSAACSSAFAALEKQNDLCDKQKHVFSDRWNGLASSIREFAPNFQPPKTGYFLAIEAKHGDVLKEHSALIIPATVFGSSREDVSIISCLYGVS